jgi:muramoyltetrapeptide carboxypeptidase
MTIGVIAPSSGIRDERLEKGIATIEEAGYKVVPADHLYDRHGYLSGSDAARGADFTAMFARKDIDAVFCGRGGYGAARMLDHVDWSVVKANPKPFVGYSDITTLHLALERRTGMVTFYGPVVVTHGIGLSEHARVTFWKVLQKPEPLGLYPATNTAPTGRPIASESSDPPESPEIRTLVSGKASGRLAGGCLSLLAAAVGTPEEPDFDGRIVLIEDIGDPCYRSDRQLLQLLRAGLLNKAAGFVIGTVTGWEKQEKEPPVITIEDVWRDLIVRLGKPAISGFPFGHEPNPMTMPLGCMAELDADSGTLKVTEPAVS